MTSKRRARGPWGPRLDHSRPRFDHSGDMEFRGQVAADVYKHMQLQRPDRYIYIGNFGDGIGRELADLMGSILGVNPPFSLSESESDSFVRLMRRTFGAGHAVWQFTKPSDGVVERLLAEAEED